jgi:hypothetical protein
MSAWQRHAEAALVCITKALTGQPENAAAALDDAMTNLNRAFDSFRDEETEPDPEVTDDDV